MPVGKTGNKKIGSGTSGASGERRKANGPNHSISSTQLTAYEDNMESEKNGGDVILPLLWPVEGEAEHNDMGEKRETLEDG